MAMRKHLAFCVLLSGIAPTAQAYNYLSAGCGVLDYNSGHMTFNYADNLSADEKAALDIAFSRTTESSDTSITTIDNGDSSYSAGNGQNEIYHDLSVGTASCYTSFNPTTCVVAEADIRFGDQPWVTNTNSQVWPFQFSSPSGRSIMGTALHEAGHCLGMAHENTMYNMMGSDWSHVTRNGVSTYYGPGEDLSNGLIDLHGERSGGSDTYRDVGATVFRYSGASGEYSTHDFGVMRDNVGTELPGVAIFLGQLTYAVTPGQVVQLEFTLENNGEADSESPNIGYYLSSNSNISSSDTLISSTSIALTRDTPYEYTQSLTVPSNAAPGDQFIGVYVDHDDLISELTNANNVAYYPVRILAPDLITTAPGVSSTTLSEGQSFTANATATNQGNQTAASTTLRYYSSADATIDSGDSELGTDFVTNLFPSGSSFESAPVTAPGTPGIYWIGACVDAVGGESVTDNQCSTGVQVTVGTPTPSITTLPVTDIDVLTATFNATVNPNGSATTVFFDYIAEGESEGFTINAGSVGAGTLDVNVSAPATLLCDTNYLMASRAVNAGGETTGGFQLFTTASCPPGC